jgi:hypothetical protein
VAILTAIAVPGFKKATEDYRLNSTVEDTLDIMKACRNYYLIFNEFPLDVDWDDILDGLLPFVPAHLIDSNHGQGGHAHRWSRRPLGKTSYGYDVDNWMNSTHRPHSSGVSLSGIRSGTADWNKLYNKFKSSLGEKYIATRPENSGMICTLPECPGSTDPSSNTLWENRYY